MIGFLILLGLLPLGVGYLLNWHMMLHPDTFPPLFIVGAVFLIVWFIVSWNMNKKVLDTKVVLLFQNSGALLAMILLTIQALSGGFWDNVMGILPQMFYMPMLYFSYCFFDWMGLYGTYFVCFLLMVLVSFLGCRRAEK